MLGVLVLYTVFISVSMYYWTVISVSSNTLVPMPFLTHLLGPVLPDCCQKWSRKIYKGESQGDTNV